MNRLSNHLFATVMLLGVTAGTPATAQTSPSPAQTPSGLPNVPITRVLAIGHLTAKANPASMRGVMQDEVRSTVQLYLTGKVADWYVRKDAPGVVFIIDVRDVAEARALIDALPLGKAGLMEFDFIPLGPLAPLGLLASKP